MFKPPKIHARSGKVSHSPASSLDRPPLHRQPFAGECPADKMKANAREEVKFKPVGVTDVTLGSMTSKATGAPQGPRAALPQADDRARRHRAMAQPRRSARSHFVQQGKIVEYASNCAEPILH